MILAAVLTPGLSPPQNLAQAIRKRFDPLGGVDLDLPRREPMGEPLYFD